MVLIESNTKLARGNKAPDFSLLCTDDKEYSLSSFSDFKAFCVVFMCNHCPYVQAILDELNDIQEEFKSKGLVLIGINSNDPAQFPEDDFPSMKEFVKKGRVKFMYLHDPEQKCAKSYGAVCTPDPFLFDKDLKLVYHGRVDDRSRPDAEIYEHSLRDAIASLVKGEEVSIREKPSIGCSIKWNA